MSDNSGNVGGLISGLLTGGILIGKICQALVGGQNSKRYVDRESGVTVLGSVSSGGVMFYRSDSSGELKTYAYNPHPETCATVTIPNELDAVGVMYSIPGAMQVEIGEVDSPNVSPAVNVTTGITKDASKSQDPEGPSKSLAKLAFSNLSIGKTVRVGSFTLSCTTAQLTIVTTGFTATAISYLSVRSDKGVSATNENPIKPTSQAGMSAAGSGEDVTMHFPIDFASLGFDMNIDTIEGQVTLEAAGASADDLAKLSKVPAKPLHPAEREFFARLSRGEL